MPEVCLQHVERHALLGGSRCMRVAQPVCRGLLEVTTIIGPQRFGRTLNEPGEGLMERAVADRAWFNRGLHA